MSTLSAIGAIILALGIYHYVTSPRVPEGMIVKRSWWGNWDDTDDVANSVRSGLVVYTDYRTGCQYLATASGGLTPRLDRDGKQVCSAE